MLRAFRRQTGGRKSARRPSLPVREWLLLLSLFGLWQYNLWVVGGIQLHTQLWTAALSVGIFLLLFVPLPRRWEDREAFRTPSDNLRRTLRFPIFWLGLLLMAYLGVQHWNPHAVQVHLDSFSAMKRVAHASWLPSGIQTPLEQANSFRTMLVFLPPWLLSCVIWIGLHSRRSVTLLLVSLAATFVPWLLVAFYQQFIDADLILGIWESARLYGLRFWGTMPGVAHAGYLMATAVGLCGGLCLHFLSKSLRRGVLGGPQWLFLVLAGVLTYALIVVQERGSLIMAAVLWLFLFALLFRAIRRLSPDMGWLSLIPGIVLVGIVAVYALRDPEVQQRFDANVEQTEATFEDPSYEPRYYTTQMAWDLFLDRPVFGWGAGAWRYYYLQEVPKHPDFNPLRPFYRFNEETQRWEKFLARHHYYDTHNDILQYLMELGVVGYAILVGIVGYWTGLFIRHRAAWDPAAWMFFATCVGFIAFCWVDFYLKNPIVHVTFALVAVLSFKRLVLRSQRGDT